MIRSAKHILKFQTDFKTGQLEQIEKDVIETMQLYVDLICKGELPLDKLISTALLPNTNITHSTWKLCIYNEACILCLQVYLLRLASFLYSYDVLGYI